MAVITDPLTGFFIGDPEISTFTHPLPDSKAIKEAFEPLILSASGWRKPFVESGKDEDSATEIGQANAVLAAHIANTFADYLIRRCPQGTHPRVVLSMDSRPTGTAIADIMCRVFLGRGLEVHFPFIAAAPEVMAYAKRFDAFAYISASHNPIGHNGIKFGLNDGGVLPGSQASILIEEFRTACLSPNASERAEQLVTACSVKALQDVWNAIKTEKQACLATYETFAREVLSGFEDEKKKGVFFKLIKSSATILRDEGKPLSLVADFNGSARAVSIDRGFFESCGLSFFALHEKARAIAHRIVPEGDSLLFCASEIERLRTEAKTPAEKNVILGYMPDCDGDRGNIVFWNDETAKAEILQAQEVFALSVIAELTHLVYQGTITGQPNDASTTPAAVVINDPTSLLIEDIARHFGVSVARAEVGEANVVNLARALRAEGTIVRILGEGSNGGNITHPAAVRDPLNTVFALLKMLIIRDGPSGPGLFRLWCMRSGQESNYREDFTLNDIRKSLPAWVTTSVYENDAILKINTLDHADLKRAFQRIFIREWKSEQKKLASDFGFTSWTAIAYNGIKETRGIADFGLSGKGGLKILFMDENQEPAGYIWMRGSGTEPVPRILADSRGPDISKERTLLDWLTKMVLEADAKIV